MLELELSMEKMQFNYEGLACYWVSHFVIMDIVLDKAFIEKSELS